MTQQDHSSRKHALCSASSSERWLECPGSVYLSLDAKEPPASPAALEGTEAHELSERILAKWIESNFFLDDEYINMQREQYGEMFDYVMEYVHVCQSEAMAFEGNPSLRIEQRLVFSEDMQMFGTADFLATGKLEGKMTGTIVDLKYGKGKKVKTEDNPQLAYYACALKKMSKKKLEQVRVTIVQPRIKGESVSITYSLDDLRTWNKKLTLGAEKALMMAGEMKTPEYKEGQWCWFCPAKSNCPEIQKRLQAQAVSLFAEE
jgi:CRISPR/Cas system-associated exonuclease Cas4 (RecB family)